MHNDCLIESQLGNFCLLGFLAVMNEDQLDPIIDKVGFREK
jgi:hypothetical protein